MKVTVILSLVGTCFIGASLGQDDYTDLPPLEVDSSEHGVDPGPVATTCKCGWANKEEGRIFGGVETKVNEFPFIVALTTSMDDPGTQFCGGSILTPKHVLTAAHCTHKKKSTGIFVSVGDHDIFDDYETEYTVQHAVSKIIDHPEYNHTSVANDISILLMQKSIKFNQYVGPVCFPSGVRDLTGQPIRLLGWGLTEEEVNSILKKTDVRMLSKATCHKLSPQFVPEGSPTQLCTYAPGKSSCPGDSGGPLLWLDPDTNRYTVVGVNSFGIADCGTKPRFATDLHAYLGWVTTTIQNTHPTYRACTKVK